MIHQINCPSVFWRSSQRLQPSFANILFVLVFLLGVFGPLESRSDDGFVSVGELPWIGWHGPLADGLHGLRFGTGGFEVNRVMKEKGLEGANAREFTLRFEGDVLGESAELVASFDKTRPSDPHAQLRTVQISWMLRGLPQTGLRLFRALDGLLEERYGEPVITRDDGVADLETGNGSIERLYYGPEAKAWIELTALGDQRYQLLIQVDCPLIPEPNTDS